MGFLGGPGEAIRRLEYRTDGFLSLNSDTAGDVSSVGWETHWLGKLLSRGLKLHIRLRVKAHARQGHVSFTFRGFDRLGRRGMRWVDLYRRWQSAEAKGEMYPVSTKSAKILNPEQPKTETPKHPPKPCASNLTLFCIRAWEVGRGK